MLQRLTVLCFAGTYGLAFAADLARFLVRGSIRWWITIGLTSLAWIVQTAYLANRAYHSGSVPLTTAFESMLVLSWLLAAIGLYLMIRAPKASVAVFIMPVVIGLLASAAARSNRDAWLDQSRVAAFWGAVHGFMLLGGAVCSAVAFIAGLMYLFQSNRLKHKRPPLVGFALPSLEHSERINRIAVTLSFPLLTAGLMTGVALVLFLRESAHVQLEWTDPKILSTFAAWLVSGILLHARFRPEMRGRRVMFLTVLAFLFLAFTLIGMDLLRIPTAHGGRRTAATDRAGTAIARIAAPVVPLLGRSA